MMQCLSNFDLDGDGAIDPEEIMALATEKRAESGQSWDADKNKRLLAKIDTNKDGHVDIAELRVRIPDLMIIIVMIPPL